MTLSIVIYPGPGNRGGNDSMKYRGHLQRLLHGELTYQIIGALMRVHSELGPGWMESDYDQCAHAELRTRGLSVRRHLNGHLDYRDATVGRFELDLLVEDTVIAELKHVARGFCPAHEIQLINYLTYWNREVGLLCNFAQESLRTKRLQNTRLKPSITCATFAEASTVRAKSITDMARAILTPIVDAGFYAYDLGCLERIFQREAIHQGVECEVLTVYPRFGSSELPSRSVKALQFDNTATVLLAGNPTGPSPQDRAKLQSYTRHAGFPCGVLVNFGKTEVGISLHTG